MTKQRQRADTSSQQGYADGYKGRRFQAFYPEKKRYHNTKLRWINRYCLRTYQSGYERGRRRRLMEQWWRKWSVVVNKLVWCSLGFLGGITLLGLLLQW